MTVTVWAVFQLAGVKVRVAGAMVASAVSLLETSTVTFSVGAAFRETLNVEVVPPSSV